MKTLKTLALATAVSAGLLGSVGAFAAKDGNLASAADGGSIGEFEIIYAQGALVRIWGFQDIDLAVNSQPTQNICVYSNGANKKYSLTIDSANGRLDTANYFELTTLGSTDKIPYGLTFTSIATGGGTLSADNTATAPIVSSTDLDAGSLLDQPLPNQACDQTNANATLLVDAGTSLPTVEDGAYSDTVYLTVAPR